MKQHDLFIGPLPEYAYKEVTDEFHLFKQDRVVETMARALYGQRMAQLALTEAQTKIELDQYDHMTGLLRRDAFIEEVNDALKRLRRHYPIRVGDKDSALFIIMDIVDLHGINNAGGQIAGDNAIEATANFIKEISRTESQDIAGRLGGDEFAILLPYYHQDIKHQEMVDEIIGRMDRIRRLDASEDKVPSLRYRYATVGLSGRLPTVKELFIAADPKRKGFEPMYSKPLIESTSVV